MDMRKTAQSYTNDGINYNHLEREKIVHVKDVAQNDLLR